MKRYAIVFPGQKPQAKQFLEQEKEFLLESNQKEGCNIFIESTKTEFGTHKTLVLYSEVPLNPDPIKPSLVIGEYYIFAFATIMTAERYKIFRDFMLSVYPQAKEVKYFPAPGFLYKGQPVNETHIEALTDEILNKFILYFTRYIAIQHDIYKRQFLLSRDIELFEQIQSLLSVKQMFEKFPEYKSSHYYNDKVDRVILNEGSEPFGDALTYVFIATGRSIIQTKLFFNENFGYDFSLTKEQIENQDQKDDGLGSTILYEIPGLTTKGNSYYSGDNKITDFIIRVKYIVILPDSGRQYIVDLIGDSVTTEDIEFPVIFGKTQFKQKISYYGPYHFAGSESDINLLHKAVSETPCPEILPLVGFGWHGNILALENIVYDTENNIFYDREGNYFFNRELKKGYSVLDAIGTNLVITMPGVPNYNFDAKVHDIEEYKDYFSQFYKDELGMFLFIYIVALINAGKFRKGTDFKFPFLILHGKYGSGKSSLSDMIKRIFNIQKLEKGQMKYPETSPFAFTHQCSYRHGLPIFISEFQEKFEEEKSQHSSKIKSLISMYDRMVISKGQQTQNIIYYNLNAIAIIDGEELPRRSALKSRSIILRIISENNSLGPIEYKEKMREPILTDLFMQVVKTKVTMEEFMEATKTGYDFFDKRIPSASARLKENFTNIYALALCFDRTLKEDLEYYLEKYYVQQYKIEQETYGGSEVLDIIKKYARQLVQNDCVLYDTSEKRFILRVNNFISFIEKYRVSTSLGIETLLQYVPETKEIEMTFGGLEECCVWNMGPDFPKQFLFDSKAYADYKAVTKFIS